MLRPLFGKTINEHGHGLMSTTSTRIENVENHWCMFEIICYIENGKLGRHVQQNFFKLFEIS